MARVEVKYTTDEFIQSCFGEGIESDREWSKKSVEEKAALNEKKIVNSI